MLWYDWYNWQFFGMHAFWWFFWIVALIVLFTWSVPVRRTTMRAYREDPLAILRRRYAAGEITTEDYEERKARLVRDMGNPRLHAPT